jgi:hypothetical protein
MELSRFIAPGRGLRKRLNGFALKMRLWPQNRNCQSAASITLAFRQDLN